MSYKLEQIEGIGPFFAERLMSAGVHNSDELLSRCSTDEGKRRLADSAAVSVRQLSTWMHQADLMRVSGIGSEFGQLLEVSGVESVEQLSKRDPENIVNLLHRVNSERKLTRAVPSIKTVAKWVERARVIANGHDRGSHPATSAHETARSHPANSTHDTARSPGGHVPSNGNWSGSPAAPNTRRDVHSPAGSS